MADAKHTPGPWVLKRDGVIVGGEVTMLPRGAVQQQVASACVVREENGDREANARLLAAAPELLALLREALEFVEDHADVTDGPDGQPQPNRAMSLAQILSTAIAKALGVTP